MLQLVRLDELFEHRIVRARHRQTVGVPFEATNTRLEEIVGPAEFLALADRPDHGRGVECQHLFDLVEQLQRLAALAVHLVDEGDDGNVAEAADLEQLAGARLYALGRVDDHDRRVDGCQRAIGMVGEILVTRRVEQVQDGILVLERHHRGGNRNSARALDGHPVGARAALVFFCLDLSGELNGAAEQQELLGQRRLAGVGMRDDGERAPAPDLADQLVVGYASAAARLLVWHYRFGGQGFGVHARVLCWEGAAISILRERRRCLGAGVSSKSRFMPSIWPIARRTGGSVTRRHRYAKRRLA